MHFYRFYELTNVYIYDKISEVKFYFVFNKILMMVVYDLFYKNIFIIQ